jgi:ABC-type branched-subunit amino acid transport system ATPase component/ABC-type branched-subunit amino acid transport system permease subunit
MATHVNRLGAAVPGGVVAALLLGLLAVVLPIDVSWQLGLVLAATWAVAAVALDLWQGTLGELSFGHVAFAAVGGYAYTLAGSSLGLSAPAAAVLALAATAVIAWITAQAVCRLSHAGAAITTLFLAFVVVEMLGSESLRGLTNGENGLMVPFMQVGPLDLLQVPVQVGLGVVCLVATTVLCHNYRRGRAGRALSMIKRSQLAAASLGIEVRSAKTNAFIFSAVFAGLAGILLVTSIGFVSPGMFTPTASILLVAMVVIGGTRTTIGPVLGAVFFALLPIAFQDHGGGQDLYIALIFLAFLVFLPTGVVGLLRLVPLRGRQRIPACERSHAGLQRPVSVTPSPGPAAGALALEVQDLVVSFGEVRALRGVSMAVGPGEVHAIVGANGAGKTTLLNVLSGAQPPTSGNCLIGGRPINGSSPGAVRALGLSRTFQHPAVSLELTALQNVSLGLYHSHRWSLLRDLAGPLGRRRCDAVVMGKSEQALQLVGMPESRHRLPAAELSMAELKQIDIARALVDDTAVVLLDEPTAGLSQDEMSQLKECLERVHQVRGLTMVIVGHHVEFLTALANRMTVLNAGGVVASGPPMEVLERPEVRAAFLGTLDREGRL